MFDSIKILFLLQIISCQNILYAYKNTKDDKNERLKQFKWQNQKSCDLLIFKRDKFFVNKTEQL